jgi:hypothetical protein
MRCRATGLAWPLHPETADRLGIWRAGWAHEPCTARVDADGELGRLGPDRPDDCTALRTARLRTFVPQPVSVVRALWPMPASACAHTGACGAGVVQHRLSLCTVAEASVSGCASPLTPISAQLRSCSSELRRDVGILHCPAGHIPRYPTVMWFIPPWHGILQ